MTGSTPSGGTTTGGGAAGATPGPGGPGGGRGRGGTDEIAGPDGAANGERGPRASADAGPSVDRGIDAGRIVVVGLWLVAAGTMVLCVGALWQLLSPDSCLTGDFDARSVRRLSREWLPPRVVCEVVAKDGSRQVAHLNYWIAFVLAAAAVPAAVAATWWHRHRSPT